MKAPEDGEQVEADLAAPAEGKPAWPKDELAQIRAVRDMLARAAAPLAPESLGKAFKGRNTAQRKQRMAEVLQTLIAAGAARQAAGGQDGSSRYFIPR